MFRVLFGKKPANPSKGVIRTIPRREPLKGDAEKFHANLNKFRENPQIKVEEKITEITADNLLTYAEYVVEALAGGESSSEKQWINEQLLKARFSEKTKGNLEGILNSVEAAYKHKFG